MRVLAVALIGWCAVARAAAAPLGLGDTLRRVADLGPDQAVARAQLPIAAAEVRTARMFPNPTIGANAGRAEPIVAGALTLHLPILGQREAHVRAAERGLEQTRLETTLALWRLRHDGRLAYYTAARADDELAIAREVEGLTRRVAEIAAERYDAGAGALLEKMQAQLVEDRARQDVSDRAAVARVARLELARIAGLEPEELGALADPLGSVGATPELASLLADAERAHPELRALEAERFAAEARMHAARADRRPVFNVDLGVELLDPITCGNAENGPRCVGPRGALSFDLPLFNVNGGPIARAEAEARAAAIKRDAAARRIEAQVRAAYESFRAAVTRAHFFEAGYVPSATQVEAMAREGFAAGRTGLLPLIEAQRALLDARLGQTEARFAVQSARAELEEASGVTLSAP
ncbi:MAG TPA: TolC family protein [Polyangia bacterium]|nr:TolC family protein [Polyangia bacterium]